MVEFHCQADDYDFARSRTQALFELEQENAKLRSIITRQERTISELSREVLDLKKRLGVKR